MILPIIEYPDPRLKKVAAPVRAFTPDIVKLARDSGVPVREDPALAQALAVLEMGDEVPEALYVAVAQTLAWAYRVDRG